MTRINTIDVRLLTDQHLMAEYREMPMVHGSLKRSLAAKNGLDRSTIPSKYTLNAGHVKFFYDKGAFLKQRFDELVVELNERGYNVDPGSRTIDWDIFTRNGLDGDWSPEKRDHRINIARILERIQAKIDWYRYGGEKLDPTLYALMKQELDALCE